MNNSFYFNTKNVNIGSSETIRETLVTQFHFKNYIQLGTPKHIPYPDLIFLEWFIGFFEAEGCFLTWPDKKGNKRFGIEITQKDAQLIYKIRTRLGFGRVIQINKLDKKQYWRFYVSDFQNLCRLFWLFNGNLITVKKNEQFQFWVNEINKVKNTDFSVLKNQVEIGWNNAWLAGFLEGDGGFYVKSTNLTRLNQDGSRSYNIKMKFYLTQKKEVQLLNNIKKLFKIPSDIVQISNGRSAELYNRLETSLLKSHLLIINYLKKYPFLGKKYITFCQWERIVGYRIKNYPITNKSILKLQRLILSTKNKN